MSARFYKISTAIVKPIIRSSKRVKIFKYKKCTSKSRVSYVVVIVPADDLASVTCGWSLQKVSNVESISISWRYHAAYLYGKSFLHQVPRHHLA